MTELVRIGKGPKTPPASLPSVSSVPADHESAGPPERGARVRLAIEGMHCMNCALGVEKHLHKFGVPSAQVDFATSTAEFVPSNAFNAENVISELGRLGYSVAIQLSESAKPRPTVTLEQKLAFSAIFTVPLMLHMVLPIPALHSVIGQFCLALPVTILGLLHFGRSGWRSVRVGLLSMDVLVTIGIVTSFLYSVIGAMAGLGGDFLFFETGASIVTFVLLGHVLEKRSVRRTTSALEDLARLQQTKGKRVVLEKFGERVEEIPADRIAVGDELLINSGDRIAVDGELKDGQMLIDESMMTGESLPVHKRAGDALVGGTVVVNGNGRMRATAIGADTVLGNIMRMVSEAQRSKPKIQKLGDRISAVFIPIVFAIAVLTFAVNLAIVGASLQFSFLRTLAVLVIACPCAMGLATPTAVAVALGRAAKMGILVKGSDTLERIPEIRTVVFDKTGTLTTGHFKVSNIELLGSDHDSVAALLVGLERRSSHPIARSILEAFPGVAPAALEMVEEIQGWGIKGVSEGHAVALTGDPGTSSNAPPNFDLYLSRDGITIAAMKIGDEIRPEAKTLVAELSFRGIAIALLSGDRKEACDAVAKELGINAVFSRQLPAQKAEVIAQLRKRGPLMFVGDGVNDAPALERADIGVALSSGTQIATQSAGVVLLGTDLNRIALLMNLAHNTLRTIKQNLFWAFFYNIVAIPLASAGFLQPMFAALAMALSDLFVIGNSLRLRITAFSPIRSPLRSRDVR